MTAAAPPADLEAARTSGAIKLSRLICIFGMIYVHAWTGLAGDDLAKSANTDQGMLRWGLVEVLGRSAVPLLSMISGWLVAGSAGKRGYFTFVGGKARTLLAPMVLWNAIAIVLVSSAAVIGLIQAPTPASLRWLVDEIFCLFSPNDINVQTPFLRDLFLCMVAVPLLLRAPLWALALAAAGALAWTVSGVFSPIILRPAIVVFFILGLMVRRLDLAPRIGRASLPVIAAPYAVLAGLRFWLEVIGADHLLSPPLMGSLDIAVRLSAAAFFWAVAWRLATTQAARPLLRLERYAFLMFCDHLILMWLGGPLVGLLTGPLGSPLYPVFLVLQPALVLLATIGLSKLLARFAPRAGAVLSGGRVGRKALPPEPALQGA